MMIIDDILDLSKIEANKLELEHIPFDIEKLIQQCVDIFSAKADQKNITLSFKKCSEAPPPLMGDPTRLSQIINNLVSNAIKFTDEGGVILSLVCAHPSGQALPLQIKINDTGIGMTKEQLTNLFEAFHQADTSTTRHFGGTGLGLTICKELAGLMNGSIEVESTRGLGSQFTVELVLDISSTPLDAPNNVNTDQYTPKHILVVDDTKMNIVIASDLLEDAGHDVKSANDCQEAVDFYKANHSSIDIILMDCLMPNMDGYEATKQIRAFEKQESLSAIPIIALTANAYKESQDKCFASGMNDFITKPIDEDVMLTAIERQVAD